MSAVSSATNEERFNFLRRFLACMPDEELKQVITFTKNAQHRRKRLRDSEARNLQTAVPVSDSSVPASALAAPAVNILEEV